MGHGYNGVLWRHVDARRYRIACGVGSVKQWRRSQRFGLIESSLAS